MTAPDDLFDERAELRQTRDLVLRWGRNATAYQILNPGFRRWFSSGGDAVVGFVPTRRYRVVAGAPSCPEERLAAVAAEFEQDARREGRQVCWFGAERPLVEALAPRGRSDRLVLGAQPVWDPAGWQAVLAAKASLRAQLHRAANKGVALEAWSPEAAAGHPQLRRCLAEWLGNRALPPLHFLVEPATLERLADRQVLVARRAAEVVGFTVASPIPRRDGWLIEQIVRAAAAPNGTAELLIDGAMRHLAARGARMVTLGLSPLSRRAGLEASAPPRHVRLLLAVVRAQGRRFYNFDGLDAFKAKFLPHRWEPVYAIDSRAAVGIGTLYAVAGAFTGGAPWRFLAHAIERRMRRAQRGRYTAAARG